MRGMFVAVAGEEKDTPNGQDWDVSEVLALSQQRISSSCTLCALSTLNRRKCDMEALSDTEWDVIISGTGLPQSLLAL